MEESQELLQDSSSIKEVEKLKLQLVQQSTQQSTSIRKVEVLEEDEYRERLDQIIERDFFPDVEKMRFELEYNEAIETNNYEKLQLLNEIREQKMILSASQTPASFETPLHEKFARNKKKEVVKPISGDNDESLSLSRFLNKYTSEDNDALDQLLAADEQKRKEKMDFMTKDGTANNVIVDQMVALPSIDEQRALKSGPGNTENRSITWKYKDRNNVMFVPEETPMTAKEIAERIRNRTIIKHENTRFKTPPVFGRASSLSSVTSGATGNSESSQQNVNTGRVGIDGATISSSLTPQVNGYKILPSTPLIDPNCLDTPSQMTWGTIDATPIRLDDGSATPRSGGGGSFFKIPDVPKRELLEQELQEQILSKRRKASASSSGSSSSSKKNSNRSGLNRLSTMSPAAQRFATGTLHIGSTIDRSLHASYTPLHRAGSSKASSTPSPLNRAREKTPQLDPR